MNDFLSKITINTKINDDVNLKKSKLLEINKPSTKEVILYFNESDLNIFEEGFSIGDLYDLNKINPKFEKRSLLEYLPSQRHPIPYCVVRYKDKYFSILRENGSGETRLIGKDGLLGGHVGFDDIFVSNYKVDVVETIKIGMLRELKEESNISMSDISSIEFKGFIKIVEPNIVENDHLAVVFLIDLNNSNIKTIEDGVISGIWQTEKEIVENINCFENWSKLIFQNIL